MKILEIFKRRGELTTQLARINETRKRVTEVIKKRKGKHLLKLLRLSYQLSKDCEALQAEYFSLKHVEVIY